MNKKLIIDLGMHKCEDTSFYLSKGYRVVAVDADPNLVESAKNRFSSYYKAGDFEIIQNAISGTDGEEVTFHISQKTLWNSLKSEISERESELMVKITVKTITLASIIKKFGAPHYCKIDIEGFEFLDN